MQLTFEINGEITLQGLSFVSTPQLTYVIKFIMTMFSHLHVIQSWVVPDHKTSLFPATNKCVLTLHLYIWGICRADGLDVINGRAEFPLYLHTHTSYMGHHISYTAYQSIYLLVSSGWSVEFTTDLHLVPKFRMCGASSPHSILSSWNPCSKQKLLTIIEEVLYKTPKEI